MLLLPAVRMLVLTFFAASLTAFAQVRPPDNRPRNCSISGRVTISGQPAANALVTASEFSQSRNTSSVPLTADGSMARTVYKVRTDADGQYQFVGLPAGQYNISVASRAFISAEKDSRDLNRTVTLDESETRDNVNFALVRGGVITGQVTDAEGRPVIAQFVNLFRIERTGKARVDGNEGYGYIKTDDRGIYRAYGLRPGQYVASVNGEEVRSSDGSRHRRTFHPETLNETQAKVIELKAGDEATDIDIKLALSGKRYEAVGRVVDAETGKPLPNIGISCGKVAPIAEGQEDGGGDSAQTDPQGNFRLAGLTSGRYAVSISGDGGRPIEYYVEGSFFEIADENISGVEVKATPGGVISGVAVVEGSSDPATKAKLSQIMIGALIQKEGASFYGGMMQMVSINTDGMFRLAGLAPGIVRLQIPGVRDRSFQLLRMERSGSEVKGNLLIGKSEKIKDLRLVFGYGSGAIRGQVQIVGGELPAGWGLSVSARRDGATTAGIGFNSTPGAEVDNKGHFVIEKLPPGDYELTFYKVLAEPGSVYRTQLLTPAKQKVSVASNSEVPFTITLDLGQKKQQEEKQ